MKQGLRPARPPKSPHGKCGTEQCVQYEGIDKSTGKSRTYFGQIEEICELNYGGDLQLAIFPCQWVKPKGVVMDDYGLTNVELQSVSYKDDHWVLASRCTQVA
jgi:hypothetical protein